MAEGKRSKAQRRGARAAGRPKAARRQARAGRKRAAITDGQDAPGDELSPDERIEWRLARLEEAVAAQSERSDELLRRVDAMLQEGSESATEDASE
jgi:hypothetical protein